MKQHRLMSRVGALVLGLAVAIATLSLASAQQEPPHRFYGTGATAGDMIGVVDDMGTSLARQKSPKTAPGTSMSTATPLRA